MSSSPIVLLVEDEPLIRLLSREMLEEDAFKVIEGQDALQALQVLERQPVTILFTDINLPGERTGLELAWDVHVRWPEIGLVITSGGIVPSGGELPDRSHFLPKPYNFASLRRAIRAAFRDRWTP